jgi:diguanylate cyclase (GGDEF)-like protein
MQEFALIDELTGLLNRRGFYVAADPALCSVVRRGGSCLVALVVLDAPQGLNDEHGLDVGDMLCDLATLLLSTLRRSDVIARLEGNEFCVFAADPTGDPDRLRDRIEHALHAFNSEHDRQYQLSATVGLAPVTPAHADTLDDLIAIARADQLKQTQQAQNRADRRHLQPLSVVPDGPVG